MTLPPGLKNSALARLSQPVASQRLGMRMSGVLPMREGRPEPTPAAATAWSLAAPPRPLDPLSHFIN